MTPPVPSDSAKCGNGGRWDEEVGVSPASGTQPDRTLAGGGLRYHFPDHLASPSLVTHRCGEGAVEHRVSSFGSGVLAGSWQAADRMRVTLTAHGERHRYRQRPRGASGGDIPDELPKRDLSKEC